MPGFVKLTERESGGDLYLRRDMVAAVGSFRGATHVTLVNEDIDYEVREGAKEVLALLADEAPRGSLTNNDQYGTIRDQRRNHAARNRQNKGEVPSTRREAPQAVQPVVRDAPPVL